MRSGRLQHVARRCAGGAVASCLSFSYCLAATPKGEDEASVRRAEAAFEHAMAAYAINDKTSALRFMQESYRLTHYDDLLYNVARLKRELGDCRGALNAYDDYLRRAPRGKYSSDASSADTLLRADCGAPKSTIALDPRLELRPQYWSTPKIVGWSLIGAGVAAGAASLYFQLSAQSAADDYRAALSSPQRQALWDASYGHQRELDAQRDRTLAIVFFAGALTSVGAGAACLALWQPRPQGAQSAFSFAATHHAATVGYFGEF